MDLYSFIILIFIVVISLAAIIFVFYATVVGNFFGAPFVKSNKKELQTILDLAEIKKNELVIDLGAGDGTILIEAAKKGAKAQGIEINPFLVLYSRIKVSFLGLSDRVRIEFGNLHNFSLRGADVVIVYLLPETMRSLRKKISDELESGARLVSNGIPIKGLNLVRKKDNIFLYHKIPLVKRIKLV